MLCALVPLEGIRIEVLPPSATPAEVLEKGPIHCVDCGFDGWKLYWTSGSYHLKEVNECASSLAKQVVKGDACLVHPNFQQHMLDDLLQSRLWRRIGVKQLSLLRLQQSKHSCDQQHVQHQKSSAWGSLQRSQSSNVENICSQSVPKRARSLQRIAAANSTRQRIVSGMNQTQGGVEADLRRQQQQQLPRQTAVAAAVLPSRSCKCVRSDSSSRWHEHITSSDESVQLTPSGWSRQVWRPRDLASPSSDQQQALGIDSDDAGGAGAADHPGSSCEQIPQQPSVLLGHSTLALAAGIPTKTLSRASSTNSHLLTNPGTSCSDRSSLSDQLACGSDVDYSATSLVTDITAYHSCQHTVVQQVPAVSTSPGVTSLSSSAAGHSRNSPKLSCRPPMAASLSAPSSPAVDSRPVAWDELPEDIVGRMARFLGKMVSDILPVYLTCRSWRRAVLENDELLADVTFCLDVHRPFKACGAAQPPVATWQHKAIRHHHPVLLQRAAKLSNLSALVTRARLLDAVGAAADAMRLWRRAAKCGAAEGQLVYGLALYRGSAGVAADPEDAHIWLSKALKQVQKHNSSSGSSSINIGFAINTSSSSSDNATPLTHRDAAGAGCFNRRVGDRGTGIADPAADVSGDLCARVQSQAGLVLGYLCFDGEGTRSDRQEAVRYFKLSTAAGWGRESREAAQVLGWIWNTGQY